MQQNVGTADRYLRIAIGSLMLACSAGQSARENQTTSWVTGLLGGMMLAEGVLGTCPVYSLVGISTCRSGGTDCVTAECCHEGGHTNDIIAPREGI